MEEREKQGTEALKLVTGWTQLKEVTLTRIASEGDDNTLVYISGAVAGGRQTMGSFCFLPHDVPKASFPVGGDPGFFGCVEIGDHFGNQRLLRWVPWKGRITSALWFNNILVFTNRGIPFDLRSSWEKASLDLEPSYLKRKNLVVLQGRALKGTKGTVGVLPTGYRPAKQLAFTVNSETQHAQVIVHPDGKVETFASSCVNLNLCFFVAGTRSQPLKLYGQWTQSDSSFEAPCMYFQDGMVFLSGLIRHPSPSEWDELPVATLKPGNLSLLPILVGPAEWN